MLNFVNQSYFHKEKIIPRNFNIDFVTVLCWKMWKILRMNTAEWRSYSTSKQSSTFYVIETKIFVLQRKRKPHGPLGFNRGRIGQPSHQGHENFKNWTLTSSLEATAITDNSYEHSKLAVPALVSEYFIYYVKARACHSRNTVNYSRF